MSSQLPSHVSYNSVWWKTFGFVIVDFLFYVIFLGCTYNQQSGLHETTVHWCVCVALSMQPLTSCSAMTLWHHWTGTSPLPLPAFPWQRFCRPGWFYFSFSFASFGCRTTFYRHCRLRLRARRCMLHIVDKRRNRNRTNETAKALIRTVTSFSVGELRWDLHQAPLVDTHPHQGLVHPFDQLLPAHKHVVGAAAVVAATQGTVRASCTTD